MSVYCKYILHKITDGVTGQITVGCIGIRYKQFNKNNNCKYFKKKLFVKNKNIKFCKDCKNFKDDTYDFD